ncbi:MAG: hypothetical protein JOY54_10795 [Acidobacteriaceae bacterium]|nr:hypothetical protein [Acidobacteriaceae bacterium]
MVVSLPKREIVAPAAKQRSRLRQPAVVIDFKKSRPKPSSKPQNDRAPITQDRLAEGLRLYLEEIRIARALREFQVQLEADLAAGSELEAGELFFDPELKIVRRNVASATADR